MTENEILAAIVSLIGILLAAASPFIAFGLYDKYRKPKLTKDHSL